MYKFITLLGLLLLTACSSIDTSMQKIDQTPRSVTITNVLKNHHVKAYRMAEKYCAKYGKVPRKLKTIQQEYDPEFSSPMATIKFGCLKPSRH